VQAANDTPTLTRHNKSNRLERLWRQRPVCAERSDLPATLARIPPTRAPAEVLCEELIDSLAPIDSQGMKNSIGGENHRLAEMA
jgi:hypothetical protein